jgi:putative transposase
MSRNGSGKAERRRRAQPSWTARASRPPSGGRHGYDGAKKVNGRKRHLLVDTLGLVCKVQVTAADVGDRDGAIQLLKSLDRRQFPPVAARLGRWRLPPSVPGLGSQASRHQLPGGVAQWWRAAAALGPAGATPPIVSPFAVVPRRWVVERTFAWLGRFRRLSKDYEYLTATSEAVIYLAMTRLLLRRLTRRWAFSYTL